LLPLIDTLPSVARTMLFVADAAFFKFVTDKVDIMLLPLMLLRQLGVG
jgi:hypothetical protein